MSLQNVRLIALDLDDTLLDKERSISAKNVEALRRAAALGIYVVLCSGRAEDAILPYVRRLDLAGLQAGRYIIAINGCSVYDLHQRKQIYCKKVSYEVLHHAHEEARKMNLYSEVYTPDTIYYQQENEWTNIDVKLCGLKGREIQDFDEFLKQGFTKMLIPGEPEKLLVLQEKLKSDFGNNAVVFTSKPYFLEVLPPNCGKGEAIEWLSNHIGLEKDSTMGFGDSMNDESMIRLCKYGVCMKNGLDYIKGIADFVTEEDNNSSGVGLFIEKHVL